MKNASTCPSMTNLTKWARFRRLTGPKNVRLLARWEVLPTAAIGMGSGPMLVDSAATRAVEAGGVIEAAEVDAEVTVTAVIEVVVEAVIEVAVEAVIEAVVELMAVIEVVIEVVVELIAVIEVDEAEEVWAEVRILCAPISSKRDIATSGIRADSAMPAVVLPPAHTEEILFSASVLPNVEVEVGEVAVVTAMTEVGVEVAVIEAGGEVGTKVAEVDAEDTVTAVIAVAAEEVCVAAEAAVPEHSLHMLQFFGRLGVIWY